MVIVTCFASILTDWIFPILALENRLAIVGIMVRPTNFTGIKNYHR